MSIRAIADAVGVTPPSIYLHFSDKDELIFAVCQAQFVRLERAMERAVTDVDDPLQRLRLLGATYVRFGTRHPEHYRILLMSKGDFTREDFEAAAIPGVGAFTQVMRAVTECMEAGYFEEQDPFLVATGLWAVVHGITSLQISVHGFPLVGQRALLDHVLDTSLRGLARRP